MNSVASAYCQDSNSDYQHCSVHKGMTGQNDTTITMVRELLLQKSQHFYRHQTLWCMSVSAALNPKQ